MILSSEIGVGGFLVSGVLGQLSLGLVFDSIGIVREPVPVSVAAVIGALMVFAGALVITLASPSTSARGGRSGGWPGKAGAGFNGEGSQYAEFDQEKTEVREIKEGEDEAEGNHVGGLCGEKQKIVAVVS